MYKLSRYTLTTRDEEGRALWYNSATGARVVLNAREARLADAWASDPGGLPGLDREGKAVAPERGAVFSDEGTDEVRLAARLVREGFFVPESRREVAELLTRLKEERRATGHLGLTVLATLDCNLACPYCVVPVTQGLGYMSPRVQQRLLAWWKEQLTGRTSCSIDWMGGEPLLYPDAFWALSGELLAIAQSMGVKVARHAIATNGTCVTPELAEQLRSIGVNHVQITLDGPEPYHDRSRPAATGDGTYRRILEGLKAVAPVCETQVRVNLTAENVEATERLLADLAAEGLSGKIQVYPARVFEPEIRRGSLHAPTLNRDTFARAAIRFSVAAMEHGFPPGRLPPPARGGFCGAHRRSHFVVGPRGRLYGCPGRVTPDGRYAVGSIFTSDRSPGQEANQAYYDRHGPTKAKGCLDCSLLPVCLGGCPEISRSTGDVVDECIPLRFCLDKQLVIEHEWLKLMEEES